MLIQKDCLGELRLSAGEIVPLGKETDRRWDHGDDMSIVDFQLPEYRRLGKMAIADQDLRNILRKVGIRELMRQTGLHQHTIEKIYDGDLSAGRC